MSDGESFSELGSELEALLSFEPVTEVTVNTALEKISNLALLHGEKSENGVDYWHAIFNFDEITTVTTTLYVTPLEANLNSTPKLKAQAKVLITDGPVVNRWSLSFYSSGDVIDVELDSYRFIPHSLDEAELLVRLMFKSQEDLEPEDVMRLSYYDESAQDNMNTDEGLARASERQLQDLISLLDSINPNMKKT